MGDQQRIQTMNWESASQMLLAAFVVHAPRVHRRSLTIGEDRGQLACVVARVSPRVLG
jgi:hypothetical protein